MKFENSSIAGKIVPFPILEDIMDEAGMIRGGQWDWERLHYDFKFENHSDGSVYYFRIPGIAVEGEVERTDSKIQLLTPYVGRHYYPHGVEYDEDFPDHVVKTCEERINIINKMLDTYAMNEK